jgi:hypothetical protein
MKPWSCLALLSGVILLGGCASLPSGPQVIVLPGAGKSYDEFLANDRLCCQYAERSIGMSSSGDAGRRATGVGAAPAPEPQRLSGVAAQRRYDETYTQCMYAHGHKVPIPEAVAKTLRQRPAPAPAPEVAANTKAAPGKPLSVIPPPPPFVPPSSPPPDYVPPR